MHFLPPPRLLGQTHPPWLSSSSPGCHRSCPGTTRLFSSCGAAASASGWEQRTWVSTWEREYRGSRPEPRRALCGSVERPAKPNKALREARKGKAPVWPRWGAGGVRASEARRTGGGVGAAAAGHSVLPRRRRPRAAGAGRHGHATRVAPAPVDCTGHPESLEDKK